jgi:D-alanyl-D-alanine carboxypeptidase
MLTILSTVVSFLMGGVPKILDMFQDKSDKKHELELARMQTEREMQMMERGYAAQAKIEEIRTDQIAIQSEAQTHMALLQHDIESAKGASLWVINARAMVRPAITYGMFALLVFVDIFGFLYAFKTGVAFDTALNLLWDDDSQQIFASIIAFYFGGQAFKK